MTPSLGSIVSVCIGLDHGRPVLRPAVVMQSLADVGGGLDLHVLLTPRDDASLRRAFEKYGKVSEAKVVNDRETGRSRGFGFVKFERAQDAQLALALDGSDLDSRQIQVREAEDKAPPPRREQRSRDW